MNQTLSFRTTNDWGPETKPSQNNILPTNPPSPSPDAPLLILFPALEHTPYPEMANASGRKNTHQRQEADPPKLSQNAKRKRDQHDRRTNLESHAITNLSSYTLTEAEHNLLIKGLSYIPTDNTDTNDLHIQRQEFIKRIHTDYYFKDKPRTPPQFHTKSQWTPPIPTHKQLHQFSQNLKSITNTFKQDNHPTTTNANNPEQQAIQSLIDNKNITIKRADKGGSIVIMDTQDYINTALKHLQDPQTYAPKDTDHTQDVADQINSFILQLTNTGHLTKQIANYIQPKTPPRTPIFYYLPKIHKPNNPPRPIISGCDSPTDNLSKYLTAIFNPIAQAQPSYLKDTKHLLQIIQQYPELPHNTILCTADVTSLYTNIPHEEGIQVILDALDTHRHLLPPNTPNNTIINTCLQFILKHNYFSFLNKHYQQTQGTAMGTKMAPPYANIFMSHIEQQITHKYRQHIILWQRFIDDIIFIWEGSLSLLQEFMAHANAFHNTIKFTFEYSLTEIHFLDILIFMDKSRRLQTTIYRKPTDKNLILHFSSHHPLHLKRNIIYTQALRYKRIISSPRKLDKELKTLKSIFLARGYPLRLIQQQISKAKLIPRTLLLKNKDKQHTTKTLLKIPFHPQSNTLKTRIHNTWSSTLTDEKLRTLWPSPPTFLNRTDKNLKELLIRTKQHHPQTPKYT